MAIESGEARRERFVSFETGNEGEEGIYRPGRTRAWSRDSGKLVAAF